MKTEVLRKPPIRAGLGAPLGLSTLLAMLQMRISRARKSTER